MSKGYTYLPNMQVAGYDTVCDAWSAMAARMVTDRPPGVDGFLAEMAQLDATCLECGPTLPKLNARCDIVEPGPVPRRPADQKDIRRQGHGRDYAT